MACNAVTHEVKVKLVDSERAVNQSEQHVLMQAPS
jgi:hypothetical protein